MIELILVRHGETDSNKKGAYLGWTDVELNKDGIHQAGDAKERLAGERVDAVFSSPLHRAASTAEIINRNFRLDIIYSDSLKERNFGIWDNLTHREIVERYGQDYELWTKDWLNYRMDSGESSVETYQRVVSFIDNLISTQSSGTFLIVTHSGCIRIILAHLLNMPMEGAWRFRLNNCGITRVEINDERYAYLTLLNG